MVIISFTIIVFFVLLFFLLLGVLRSETLLAVLGEIGHLSAMNAWLLLSFLFYTLSL